MPKFSSSRTTNGAIALLAFAALATGCALPGQMTVARRPDQPLHGPRVLAFIGSRGDVADEIEDRLRDKGFRVKRFASVERITRVTSGGQLAQYDEASARYAVETDARVVVRCFGGGYRLTRIRVDVIDLASNEVVLSLKGSGYTEDCEPMSGTIFADVANAISGSWEPPGQ